MMDEESRAQLIAQATLQNARLEARRARQQLPLGLFVVALGVGVSTAVALTPLGLLGSVFTSGVGFVLIPLGLAVVIRSAATIARSRKAIRALAPPEARAVTRS